MRTLLRRLLFLLRRDRHTQEIDEELRFHAAMKADAYRDEGMSDADARAAAQRRVGNPLRLRERSRDPWMLTSIETCAQDVRHALRLLRRDPTFTLAALATLALGIGLNTAIFSVAYGVLWRPLPYREPDRLIVMVPARETPAGVETFATWTPDDYLLFRDRATVFDALSAHTPMPAQLTGQGEPLQLRALEVTPSFFAVLGVSPALGRTFLTGSAAADDDRSVIVSDRIWRTALRSDPAIIGRPISIDGLPRTVVGVMPASFSHRPYSRVDALPETDVWLPNRWAEGGHRNAFLSLTGRLKAGIDAAGAQAALTTTANQQPGRHPKPGERGFVHVTSLHEQTVGAVRRLLLILLGAVAFVLLIACVNVANLQMARLSARRVELSVRIALGAGRRRLVRQLLTESAVLSATGGTLGVLLAFVALRVTLPVVPETLLPRLAAIAIDGRVLAFCLALAILTSLIVGLLPALRAAALDNSRALHAGESRTTTDRQGERLRTVLVAGQVALTLVLLVGAGLLIHSFVRLTSVAPGFESGAVRAITITLPERLYEKAPQMQQLTRALLDRIRQLPGAESASAINAMPFGNFYIRGTFSVEGQPPPKMMVGKPKVEAAYFETMGIPVRQGREFTAQDDAAAPKVAIVSESFARRFWPKGDAIGHRVRLDGDEWQTVVGVVADVRQTGLDEPTQPMVYVPFQQETREFFLRTISFVVRTRAAGGGAASGEAAASVAEAVRAEIRRLAPELPIESTAMLDEFVARSVAQPRFRTLLLALFALSATLIACCGIYGLMAYAVAQRRREIGVRLALGAERRDVLGLVLARALRTVIAGVAIGLVASLSAAKLLRSFLYEITPTDPLAFTAVTIVLFAVAIVAAWLPARRAASTDPVAALRAE